MFLCTGEHLYSVTVAYNNYIMLDDIKAGQLPLIWLYDGSPHYNTLIQTWQWMCINRDSICIHIHVTM